MNWRNRLRGWIRPLGWLGVALSLAIMGYLVWTNAAELRTLNWQRFIGPVVMGLAVYGLSLALQGIVWIRTVARLTGLSWGWWDIEVYSVTHLMRRLPGGPWYMAGRAVMYGDRGRGGAEALAVSLLEWAGLLIAGAIWFLAGRWGVWGCLASAGGIAIIGWLAYHLRYLQKRFPGLQRWLPVAGLSPAWLGTTLASYLFSWFLGGLILYLLAGAASPLNSLSLLNVTVLWAAGGSLGMLAVMMPAGFGVREVTLTVLLQPFVGAAMAVVITVLLRVLFTVGDMIWGMIFLLVARRKQLQTPVMDETPANSP